MVSQRRALGERLKRQRERSGVSLESIARSTKVAVSLYAGLERGDCSRWPAGIYGRAYVKAYAEAIGLNALETVEEFNSAFCSDGGTAQKAARHSLRLTLDSEPTLSPELFIKRAALAAADLVIGCLITSVMFVGAGAGVWSTVAAVLGYFVVGRLISDSPLLYWVYLRMRSAQTRHSPEPETGDVAVGDAASTTA